ncbi:MAG: AraC family transcriptional regulator [Cellvibrionaceae bacterium]
MEDRKQRINNAYQFILDNFEEHFTLQDIADAVSCSKYHLNREFSELTGLNIGEFVQRRRLSRAEKLLKEKNASVIDVALQVGYQSHSSFTRAFKKMFGYSPTQDIQTISNLQNNQTTQPTKFKKLPIQLIKRELITLQGLWGEGFHNQSFNKIAAPLFGKVMQTIHQAGAKEQLPLLGISRDNPLNIPEQKAQFFAGTKSSIVSEFLDTEIWPKSYYLHCIHDDPPNTLWQTISQLYINYIYPEHIAAPEFQIFYQFHTDAEHNIVKTDIFIPLNK